LLNLTHSKIAMSDIPLPSVSLLTSCVVLLICVFMSALVYPLRFPSQRVIQYTEPQPSGVADPNAEVAVNIRIEGRAATIFEGTIRTTGKTVTTTDGTRVTGRADGTNGNEYPFPVPTCTSALADAATGQDGRPVWGGTYHIGFDDFFIQRIGEETAGRGEFWQLALNFRRANLGGGQMRIRTGDSVLWALIKSGSRGSAPLKLKGPRSIRANTAFTVTVTDGETHGAVEGATVGGRPTDRNGQVKITSGQSGETHRLQADYQNRYVRSNVLMVAVTA